MAQRTLMVRALRRCKCVLPRGRSDAARRAYALDSGPGCTKIRDSSKAHPAIVFSFSSLLAVNDVRTIQQQSHEDAMTAKAKKLFLRTPSFAEDAAGVAVLFLLLFAGLTLSGTA